MSHYDATIDAQQQLLSQRVVFVSGPLDAVRVSETSALLMALDGRSSNPVELVVNSRGGPTAEVIALLDVLPLMRAPVEITCIGSAIGTAAALVAAGTGERRATARATLSLRCDESVALEGPASDLLKGADQVAAVRARIIEALVAATGQDETTIAGHVDRGPTLTAEEALALGVIDKIADRRGRG